MNLLKRLFTAIKVGYYLLRLLIAPKKSIIPLIKLGNIISNSKAFDAATEKVIIIPEAKELIELRYGEGIPEIEELMQKPEGSFGITLGAFMKDLKLSRYPFPINKEYSKTVYLRERRRHIHDILHVVLDYDTSLEGEAKVNAFICGQAAFPIPVIISAGVLLISLFKFPDRVGQIYSDLTEAYQRGNNSPSIFSIRWEEKWNEPVEEMRKIFVEKKTDKERSSKEMAID